MNKTSLILNCCLDEMFNKLEVMKAFYFDIEPYKINVSGMPMTVLPMDDGVYRVSCKRKVLADLYPEITAAGIYWNGFGQISPLLAEQIGIEINACEI